MNTPVHSSPDQREGRSVGSQIVRVLQGQAGRLHRAARLAMDNPVRRSLLKLLVSHDQGVTYRTLLDALPVSERWVRQLVADLRQDGIVETPGNPALIQFTSREMAVAVREVLAFLASEWAETVARGRDGVRSGLSQLVLETSPGAEVENYLKIMSRVLRGGGG